jgi:hypothetical protein
VADSTTERPDSPAAVPPDPYAPFYIWISGTADAPQVAVDHAPGGDLAQSALDVRYLPAVQRLAGLVHGGATDPGTVANLGRGLYAILFTPALRDLYQRSLGRLAAGGRLRLLLRVDPPALAALPWELLYDPTDNVFLALDPLVSVARYLPQAARPAPAPRSGPLRVLAVFAGPTDLPALDLPRELALIVTALQTLPPGQVALDVLMDGPTAAAAQLGIVPKGPPTPAALTDAIGAGYDVLHYGGHGALQDGGGLLALENADRSAAFFDAASLGIAVKGTRLRLAVLTACQTAAPAAAPAAPAGATAATPPAPATATPVAPAGPDVAADETTRGGAVPAGGPPLPALVPGPAPLPVAPTLIAAGLPAVVAMQADVPDASAVAFSRTFYTSLARNVPIDAAVSEARKTLRLTTQNLRADWGIPVLFLQDADNGYLWAVPGQAMQPTTPAPTTPATPAIQVGSIDAGGGPVAVGGDITDQRTITNHGGFEFLGPAVFNAPVASGDQTIGSSSGQGSLTINTAADQPATSPPVTPPAADLTAQVRPAFAALVAAIDDDAALDQARALRKELLSPAPGWSRISALRKSLAQQGVAAPALAAFFADPVVNGIVQAAKLRALEE